ncbi:MAG TPA: S8 family serine peptidase [Thermoanaerobaculia bacterium]|nr:S8 family serine peptidase [Thermoanaerobaculia bacterium]
MRTSMVLAGLCLVTLSYSVRAGELIQGENAVKDRYIVVLKAGIARRPDSAPAPGLSVAEVVNGLAQFHGGRPERVYEHALQGAVLAMTEAQARSMAKDPRVAYIEQDQALDLFTNQAPPVQWGLNRIDERDRPLNNHFTYTTTGAGVNAYVLDTGIGADSIDFGSRVVNAFTVVRDSSGNLQHGDCNGHGTSVAKALGGQISGVAKGVKLYAVRVGSVCGSCSSTGRNDPPLTAPGDCEFLISNVISGVNWVTANRIKPAVANLSLGGSPSQALDDAVRGMLNAGVIVVVAAGNGGISACDVSPARISEAITVGATDSSDARAIFDATHSSNTGSCLDLFAPGKDLDLWNIAAFSGTSAAAPLVAGAAARYLQSSPAATQSGVQTYLVNNATPSRLSNIGSGSPNRLLFTPPGGSETDSLPVANFTYSCSGLTCTFTNTSTDDFGILIATWTFGHPNDFQPQSGNSFPHTFPGAGSYSVTLSVNDDAGQPGQKVKVVTVN